MQGLFALWRLDAESNLDPQISNPEPCQCRRSRMHREVGFVILDLL
jgi:hypothetical protein